MSRSYKKSPICTDYSRKNTKDQKRFANRKVRRAMNVPNGKAYRKYYESWEIHDWISRQTLRETICDYYTSGYWDSKGNWNRWYEDETLKEHMSNWAKYYKRK